ncbi:CCA tRNA nucleotidyltransferase [uncultured Anaerococcus sp.]|uniref:CCA tRNA nucleotidyltransferase n=1 Tax=uncultured Anaerococcus sp. TaxID=293428 RepID=UPI0026015DB0|nr:HD domain-containing protein [uncultured Anaerococcus sp.]
MMITKEEVLKRLEEAGFPSYLVGGFVRDKLMDKTASDIDIATKARPDDIKEVFKDFTTIDVGRAFGTIKLVADRKDYEITTFRTEGAYNDKRRPSELEFSDKIEDDLKRRDFTINAMAIRRGEVIDPHGGRADLEKKIIRAVGNPYERIGDDYLRALRAVSFAARFDFEIDFYLKAAIKENKTNLAYISKERQRRELDKILLSENPAKGIRLLDELELLELVLPEVKTMVGFNQHSPHHYLDCFDHTMKVLENTRADLTIRLAALFHDVGKPITFFLDEKANGRFFGHDKVSKDMAEKRLKDLKYPKKIIADVGFLISRHMDSANTYTKKSVGRLLRKLGEENLKRLFDLQEADILATVNKDTENIERGRNLLKDILEEKPVLSRRDLAIDGRDLIELGIKEGPGLGKILKEIEKAVFYEDLSNDRKTLLNLARILRARLDRQRYE